MLFVKCRPALYRFSAGSEGTHFVYSYPRTDNEYTTELRITARTDTRATLFTDGSLHIIDIPAGGSATHKGQSSDRVTYGLENKGFELKSDFPITATVGSSSHDSEQSPDDMLLRPLSYNDTEYFIISFLGSSRSSSRGPQSFFSITAAEDDTDISIYENDGSSYSDQSLNR